MREGSGRRGGSENFDWYHLYSNEKREREKKSLGTEPIVLKRGGGGKAKKYFIPRN